MKSFACIFFIFFGTIFGTESSRKTRRGLCLRDTFSKKYNLHEAKLMQEKILAKCFKKFPDGPSYLGGYNIKNWPINVPARIAFWTDEHIAALRKSLPKLKCESIQEAGVRSSICIKARRRFLLDKLVKKFNANTGLESKRVLWARPNRIDRFRR